MEIYHITDNKTNKNYCGTESANKVFDKKWESLINIEGSWTIFARYCKTCKKIRKELIKNGNE